MDTIDEEKVSDKKVLDIYNQIIREFNTSKDKKEIIQILIDCCDNWENNEVYLLKKKLDIEFALAVNCQYAYTFTPNNYGCDLREIIYNTDGTFVDDEKCQELLNKFKEKKIDDVWHIMTDIDDTLYPNTEHGTYIAGSDNSWQQKTPYPGIQKFYNSFYNTLQPSYQYSTVLSATPGMLKTSKLRNELLKTILGKYSFIQGIESKTTLLQHTGDIVSNLRKNYLSRSSDVSSDVSSDINNLFTLFGNLKFRRFQEYLTLFPEYKILFIGDNGQGDVLAGKQMVEYNENCHVFIHKVSRDGNTYIDKPNVEVNHERLHLFDNYYNLSKIFQTLGIFKEEHIQEIKSEFNNDVRRFNTFKLYKEIESTGGKKTHKNNRKNKYNKSNKYRKRKTKRIRKKRRNSIKKRVSFNV